MIDPKKIFSKDRIDEYKERNPERVAKFREKLRKELLNPKVWYDQPKIPTKRIFVFHPECPYATSKQGRVQESWYVWWLHNPEDEIQYNEVIHHKNGDPKDNRIENLEKISRKIHIERHKKMGSYGCKPNSAIHKKEENTQKTQIPQDNSQHPTASTPHYCCPNPTCSSSNSPPFTNKRECGNCFADCDGCEMQFKKR